MKSWLLFFLFIINFEAKAQLDTLFWFVAPEVAQSHGDRPIVFRFATLNQAATITVSQPANPLFPTQVLNLVANDAQTHRPTQFCPMDSKFQPVHLSWLTTK